MMNAKAPSALNASISESCATVISDVESFMWNNFFIPKIIISLTHSLK